MEPNGNIDGNGNSTNQEAPQKENIFNPPLENEINNKPSSTQPLPKNTLTPRTIKKNKSYVEAFGKVIKNSTLNNEIKVKFADYLEKLNDNDTKHIGFKELKLLINKYPSKEYVGIYSPILLSYNKNTTTSSKEFQIILIGYMIATCGFNNIAGYKSFNQIIEAITNFMKVN
jgi:hypothetical protein